LVDSYIGNIPEHKTRIQHLALTLIQTMWSVYRYMKEKTLKNKGFAINENYKN